MQENSQEVFIAILASIGLFICIAMVMIYFIVHFQKKKFEHKEQMISIGEENKRQLVQSRLEVEEQTKLYIARELHDNIGTLSSLIKMNLNLLSSSTGEEERKSELLAESKELIKTLITDVKQLSLSLNTDRITKMSISKAIQMETTRLQKLNLFIVEYSCEGDEWPIAGDKQIVLYRICQELLHNIIKHAKPFKVSVSLKFDKALLHITITDDGAGFIIHHPSISINELDGSGLVNIYNRIGLLGGKLILDSSPGKGTKCYIEVPFTNV